MSSIDSALLSGASYLCHNIFSPLFPSKPTLTFFTLSVLFLGLLSATFSILYPSSIYDLWFLAGDLGFVLVFPQFFCSVHLPDYVNGFGAVCSIIMGGVLRFSNVFNAFLSEMIPVKSVIMLCSFCTLILTSNLFRFSKKLYFKLDTGNVQ